MLNWLFRRRREKKLKEFVSRYLPPQVVEHPMSVEPAMNQLTQHTVEFVFAVVRGATPNNTGERMGTVADIACRNGWIVETFLSSLVVIVDSRLLAKAPRCADRSNLINALIHALGSDIKIVHGVQEAHFGQMGSINRAHFGVLLPCFLDLICVLKDLPFGQTHEYRG